MKSLRILLFSFFLIACSVFQSTGQSFQWLSRTGGPSSDPTPLRPDELINDVVADSQGNVYVCGRTRGNADINGQSITTYGGNDIFLAKFDCGGNLIWVKAAGNPVDGDNGLALALDGIGNIYITGTILGDDLTRPITLFDTVLHVNVNGMFLAKLDTSGNFIWGKIAQTASRGEKLVIDLSGKINILLNCPIAGEIFPGTNVMRAFYIARFDSNGNIDKMLQITDDKSGGFRDMKISAENEFYFVGDWPLDTNTIGGMAIIKTSPQTFYDFFCIKLDTSGIAQWNINFGLTTGTYNFGFGCALDWNGDLFLTGGAYNGLVLGNDTMNNTLSATAKDFPFIAKVNPNGQVLWARNMHITNIGRSTGGITVKSNGNAVISGFFSGPVIIGPDSFTSIGTNNLFIAEFSGNGTVLGGESVPTISGGSYTEPRRTVSDAADNIFFAGAYSGNLIINGNTIPYAGGYTDGFLIKWGTSLCTVGIDGIIADNNKTVLVYPNPAVDELRFKFKELNSKESILIIFDAMGREVKTAIIPAQTIDYPIELHGLSSGFYYYSIANSSSHFGGKFMVDRRQ